MVKKSENGTKTLRLGLMLGTLILAFLSAFGGAMIATGADKNQLAINTQDIKNNEEDIREQGKDIASLSATLKALKEGQQEIKDILLQHRTEDGGGI